MKRAALAFAVALVACNQPASAPIAPASSPSAQTAAPPSEPLQILQRAEYTRDASLVSQTHLASGDLSVRRAAVRALARIQDPKSHPLLIAALADGDPQVLAWSAYGLGQLCPVDRDETVRRLALRSASLAAEPAPAASQLDPWDALGRAFGECATTESERTLTAWLDASAARSTAASFALGDVATRNRRIEEETAAALLKSAEGDAARSPQAAAFYPFARLRFAPPRAADHLLGAVRRRIGHPGPYRVLAVRALATLGDEAVPELVQVLTAPSGFTPQEQAEAARALGRIGTKESRKALGEVLSKLAPSANPEALTTLGTASFGVLMTTIEAIAPAAKPAQPETVFRSLAALPVPPQAPAHLKRRVLMLRCAAAVRVAGANQDDPLLHACDETRGQLFSLSHIQVLDQGPLHGARSKAWRQYLSADAPARVREAALLLLRTHDEVADAPGILESAIKANEPGVVATAAQILAEHPERGFAQVKGSKRGGKVLQQAQPSATLVQAVFDALARSYPPDALETRSQLARAAGALRIDEARDSLRALCASPNPTLHEHARAALRKLGGKPDGCVEPGADTRVPGELGRLLKAPVTMKLDTDVGELRLVLDPELAPVAVTRMVELARKGFYNGMAVHRVVPGFVVQFGDPSGDGYGGSGDEPLRCETSPLPFGQGAVGVALGGRDTGSSQMFVTLAPSPHLDGRYPLIGKAEGPWEAVAEGDVIKRVQIDP